MTRTFRYPLHLNRKQAVTLSSWLESCRQLYNAALEQRRDAWRMRRKSLTMYDQFNDLTELRSSDERYAAMPALVSRSALFRLDQAFRQFFKRAKGGGPAGFPRFRGFGRYDSCAIGRVLPDGNRLHVPKLGFVKFNLYRELKGEVREVTIRRSAKRWWVCFACDLGEVPEKVAVRTAVGIDLGLNSFAVLSDGMDIPNPRFFREGEARLAKLQRVLAAKKKGSKSRERAKSLVGRTHEHVQNQRTDFARKLASRVFAQYDLVAHEDLKIRNMAKGTFAKSINDAAWGGFIRALASKAEYAGKHLIPVDPRGTSQRCSSCGGVVKKSLSEREHRCPCGLVASRDRNAALNVLALGRSAVEVGPKGESVPRYRILDRA